MHGVARFRRLTSSLARATRGSHEAFSAGLPQSLRHRRQHLIFVFIRLAESSADCSKYRLPTLDKLQHRYTALPPPAFKIEVDSYFPVTTIAM
jgi:hypothetical protein